MTTATIVREEMARRVCCRVMWEQGSLPEIGRKFLQASGEIEFGPSRNPQGLARRRLSHTPIKRSSLLLTRPLCQIAARAQHLRTAPNARRRHHIQRLPQPYLLG